MIDKFGQTLLTAFDFGYENEKWCKKNNSNIKAVNYVSAKTKLSTDDENNIQIIQNTKDKTKKYKMTKERSIEIVGKLIEKNEKYSQFFQNKKKKDDLADALLQALSYYIKKNNNNIHYKIKNFNTENKLKNIIT